MLALYGQCHENWFSNEVICLFPEAASNPENGTKFGSLHNEAEMLPETGYHPFSSSADSHHIQYNLSTEALNKILSRIQYRLHA